MTEAVGKVAEDKSGKFHHGDLVFARGLGGSLGEWKSVAVAPAAKAWRLPPNLPLELAAHFAKACTAYHLVSSVQKGDVVVHTGAETAVGQFVAQMCAMKGARTVSFISAHQPDPVDAVDLLKNLGSTVSAPGCYCETFGFLNVMKGFDPPPALLLLDASDLDTKSVNELLKPPSGYTATKALVKFAHREDKQDSNVLRAIRKAISPNAKAVQYHGLAGAPPILGAQDFDLTKWLETAPDAKRAEMFQFVSNAFEDQTLKVWCEKYTTAKARYMLGERSFRHPFRQPLWLAEP